MRLNTQETRGSGFTILASFVIVAAVLSIAKEVFIPIALASLLTFLLAPLVARLSRWGLGKILSVVVVVTLASAIIAAVGWTVTSQIIQLAEELPNYQQNLRAKIVAFKKPNPDGILSRASGVVKELQKELDAPEAEVPGAAEPFVEKPVAVEVQPPKTTPSQVIGAFAGPILKPLATAGAVAFFVILMLLQREDLRERFLKLVSGGELNVATQAVDDAANRVSRYLLMQLIVNATYGIPIGVGLYFIGVPNAFLWGLLATILRFIPFIGPWIAAAFPIVLSIAVDPGWTKPLLTISLFLVLEVISNNLIEPLLYGASTGVSNIALLMAAIFWTWLWGPVGLLLSAPLTVCLLVLGKYVPGLKFLSVLLGSDPVLEPEARFYQRMLAMDEDGLISLADEYLEDRSLTELYDSVILPALQLAEQDRHKGALAEVRQAFIVQTTRELIELLGTRKTGMEPPDKTYPDAPPVLCVPARDEADELAAVMLVQLLTKSGIPAQNVTAKILKAEWLKQIRNENVTTVCVCGVPPLALAPARQICRQFKQEFPKLKVIVGIWDAHAQPTEVSNHLGSPCPEAIVTRMAEALIRFDAMMEAEELTRRHTPEKSIEASVEVQPVPPSETEPEEIFTSVVRQAAKILNVPVSLVSLVDTDRPFWRSHGGVPPDLLSGQGLRDTPLLRNGLLDDLVAVEDINLDPRFANEPLLQNRGIRFYAGVPLRTGSGHLVGALCVTDTEPHQVSDRAKALLKSLADRLVQEVEGRKLKAA